MNNFREINSELLKPSSLEFTGAVQPSLVQTDGRWLKIKAGDPNEFSSTPPNPPTGMLNEFVRLKQGSRLERFVSKWGGLGICKHGFPSEHDAPWSRLGHHNGFEPDSIPDGLKYLVVPHNTRGQCRPEWQSRGEIYREPVERYVYFANQARTILERASELQNGLLGEDEEWSRIFAGFPVSNLDIASPPLAEDSLTIRRAVLMNAINEWLYLGDVSPTLILTANGPEFRLSAGLFGIIGVQLMFAATAQRGLAVCSSCAIPYAREKRLPKKGQNNYCKSCGDRARWRISKRKNPANKKEG